MPSSVAMAVVECGIAYIRATNRLADVSALLEYVDDWRSFLADNLDDNDAELLRRHERTGRPLGGSGLVERIEKMVGRALRPNKPGRKPKTKGHKHGVPWINSSRRKKVGKSRMLTCFIAVVPIIVVCSYLLLLAKFTRGTLRELPQRQIRPMLKRFMGPELPSNADNLRALFHNYRGLKGIYLAFHTDQQGWSYFLDAFAGKHIQRHEFPQPENNPFQWAASIVFGRACRYQDELGVRIFDEDLINQIQSDYLQYLETWHYPKDAVTGYYLKGVSGDPTAESVRYYVLVFKDRGLVYIYLAK